MLYTLSTLTFQDLRYAHNFRRIPLRNVDRSSSKWDQLQLFQSQAQIIRLLLQASKHRLSLRLSVFRCTTTSTDYCLKATSTNFSGRDLSNAQWFDDIRASINRTRITLPPVHIVCKLSSVLGALWSFACLWAFAGKGTCVQIVL